jgi:heme A synthase
METLRLVLLVLHLLGFAALFGGLIVQVRTPEKVVNAAMRDGVGTAFLAGLLLVGVLEAGDDPVDHTKIAVKFAIGLVILVLVMMNMRKERIPQGLWAGILLLAIANVGVAVFWSPVHQ